MAHDVGFDGGDYGDGDIVIRGREVEMKMQGFDATASK
jgi:hypothetical protein